MKAMLSLLLCLSSLSSCCSLFCPEEEQPLCQDPSHATGVGTTPGNNVAIIITPTAGRPQMWASYNLNGNATSGSPSGHRIWVGSDDQDFQIHGDSSVTTYAASVSAPQGTTYALDITGLIVTNPATPIKAELKNQAAGTTLGTVTPFRGDGATSFTVVVREALPGEVPGNADNELILQVAAPGGGAKFIITN